MDCVLNEISPLPPSTTCLLTPNLEVEPCTLRLVEGEEAEQWRDGLEGLSDWNKVTTHKLIILAEDLRSAEAPEKKSPCISLPGPAV